MFKKIIAVTYLEYFFVLLVTSGMFWTLESQNPKILRTPRFGYFSLFFNVLGVFPTQFLPRNYKFPSFLEFSRKFREIGNFIGISQFWHKFDIWGIISTQFCSLNLILPPKIENYNVLVTQGIFGILGIPRSQNTKMPQIGLFLLNLMYRVFFSLANLIIFPQIFGSY